MVWPGRGPYSRSSFSRWATKSLLRSRSVLRRRPRSRCALRRAVSSHTPNASAIRGLDNVSSTVRALSASPARVGQCRQCGALFAGRERRFSSHVLPLRIGAMWHQAPKRWSTNRNLLRSAGTTSQMVSLSRTRLPKALSGGCTTNAERDAVPLAAAGTRRAGETTLGACRSGAASIRLHRAVRDGGEEIGRTELTNLSRRAWRQPRTALLSGGNLGLRSARLTSDAYDGAVPRVNL